MPLKRVQIKLPRLKVFPFACEPKVDVKTEFEPNQQVVIPTSALPLMPSLMPAPPLRLISPQPPPPPPQQQQQSQPPLTDVVPVAMTNSSLNSSSSKLEQTRFVQSMGEDEFTFFGLSVAAQLRSMPLANAMVMQSKIQYMLSTERRKINGDTTEVNLFS